MEVYRIGNELNFYKTMNEALITGAKPEDIQKVEINLSSCLKNEIYEEIDKKYLYQDASSLLEDFVSRLKFETEDESWDAFEKVTGCNSEEKLELFLLKIVKYFKDKFDCNLDPNSMWDNAFDFVFKQYVVENARETFPKDKSIHYTYIMSFSIDKYLNDLEIGEKIICRINKRDAIIKRINLFSGHKEFAIYYDECNDVKILSENHMQLYLDYHDLKIEIENIQLYNFISIEKLAEKFIGFGSIIKDSNEILFSLDNKNDVNACGEPTEWYAIRKTHFFDSSQIVMGKCGGGSFTSAEVEKYDTTILARQIRKMLSDELNFNGKFVCVEKNYA